MSEEAVLEFLEKNEEISDSGKFAEEKGISHEEIVNIIKSLNGFCLVDAQDIKRERWVLTQEGELYSKYGSPEVLLFSAVPPEGIAREELQKSFASRLPNDIDIDRVDDRVKNLLIQIHSGEGVRAEDIDALKKRKLISSQIWKGYQ
ncbi:Probable phenylalanine--tRNA ligase alpha subunit [Striga hermonthica]|uniref:Probable phenylalanine--tRNA ligase alpha subunit n=1 Tax=Striga hermonthica TaxID=68872 RepID=A0A9N7MCS8_STRHE|nr:Probable phenylalanine--tRNA ligase alpha subunit [Striga hermonthica]